MFINIAFCNKMDSEFYILLLFSVFPFITSHDRECDDWMPPGFGEYNGTLEPNYFNFDRYLEHKEYNFRFPVRLPHWIGDILRFNQMVIRTFPTEINDFKENTEYTKNISLEMETSCGSSKSAFDKTDLVTLTLMEKQDKRSIFIKTIQVDPLSVDFYSPKLTMKQFKILAEVELEKRAKYCLNLCMLDKFICSSSHQKNCDKLIVSDVICPKGVCTCYERTVDYPKSFAEMEKFVKIIKYLELFQDRLPSCRLSSWGRYQSIGVVELDNKTASMFPNLNNNHYFVASFTDTKRRKSAALILKDYKII